MFAVKLAVVFTVLTICGAYQTCPGHKHYEELRCKPINDKPDDQCPSRYECSDITKLDRTKCHLNDKEYTLGNKISSGLPTCTTTCTCDGAEDEFGFSCKFDECAEAKEPPNPECAYQFTINSCCATNVVCNKADIDKLPRCWSDGHEFVKGNLIYSPRAPCYKCLCDEKFNNQTEIWKNPSCQPVDCGIEVHQLSYLQLGCAPVYFDDGLCCPFEFKCPIETDVIESSGSKSTHTCKYGDKTLNVGDTIKTDDPCVKCSCDVPPMVSCIRTITTEKCH